MTAVSNSSVLDALPDELVQDLGKLHAQDEAIATLALQLLPFGSRANLQSGGFVVRDDEGWHFTTEGWDLLRLCSESDRSTRPDSAIAALRAQVLA